MGKRLFSLKRMTWPLPLVIAVIGIGATLALSNASGASSDRLDKQHYESLKVDTLEGIEERVRNYEDAFLGGTALYAASTSVERGDWRAFAEGLSLTTRYPGLLGIGVIYVVHEDEVPAYQETHGRDVPGFSVQPVPGFASDGDRYVITFVEPAAANGKAIGLDLASEPVRKFAADRSRDQGTTAFSDTVALVQDTFARPGFLMFRPIYKKGMPTSTVDERRAALEGWVYAPFITEDFFSGILGAGSEELTIRIYKGAETGQQALVYGGSTQDGAASANARQTDIQPLVLKGELFTIGFTKTSKFASAGHGAEKAILFLGLATSIAFAAMIWALISSRRRALGTAERATRELRESVAIQRAIVDGTAYAIIAARPDGTITTFNPAAERLLGYTRDEVVGKTDPGIFHDPAEVIQRANALSEQYETTVEAGFEAFVHHARIVGSDENEWTYIRKDGDRIPVRLAVTPLHGGHGEITGYVGIARDLVAEKHAQATEARLAAIVGASGDAMYSMDADGMLTSWNHGAEQLLGYSFEEAIGMDAKKFVPTDMTGEVEEIREAILANRVIRFETIRQRKDGEIIDVSATLSPLRDSTGAVIGMASVLRDVTEKKKAELAQARLAAIVDSSTDAIVSFDIEGRFLTWNKGAEEMFGYTAQEATGQQLNLMGPDGIEERRAMARAMRDGTALNFEATRYRKDGTAVPVSISQAPIVNSAGSVVAMASVIRDISDQVRTKQEMEEMVEVLQSNSFVLMEQTEEMERLAREAEFLANHDALTGVFTRRSWWNAAGDGDVSAIAVLDIDFFKSVNDTYGHPGGDVVLREVAERLAVAIGESGSLGRIGGEEFGIAFRGSWTEAEAVARRCVDLLPATPIVLSPGVEITVSVSAGLAAWKDSGDTEKSLKATYDLADRALYAAKESGRRRLCLEPRREQAA